MNNIWDWINRQQPMILVIMLLGVLLILLGITTAVEAFGLKVAADPNFRSVSIALGAFLIAIALLLDLLRAKPTSHQSASNVAEPTSEISRSPDVINSATFRRASISQQDEPSTGQVTPALSGSGDSQPSLSKPLEVPHSRSRTILPQMPELFEWGIIKSGDEVYCPVKPDEKAIVVDPRTVKYQGQTMTFNEWARAITGWKAVNIYEWTYLVTNGKSLNELRKYKMEALAAQEERKKSR